MRKQESLWPFAFTFCWCWSMIWTKIQDQIMINYLLIVNVKQTKEYDLWFLD
jgi:hypothetical protein